jgi:hypothetical protein
LNSPTVVNGATARSSDPKLPIDLMVKRRPDATYLFAVGMRNRPVRGSFVVSGLPTLATVQVLGEDRAFKIMGGQFADDFAAYGVHIYRITGTGAGGSAPNGPRP